VTTGPTVSRDLHAALAPHGIFVRGIVNFDGDGPALENGSRARSVALLGNIGGSIWKPFSAWRQNTENAKIRDPLDDWSKSIIKPLARALEATAYFPSDPPWQPFQQWAMRAEGLKASPLGILIHPEYGLWHGYRGALGFSHTIDTGFRPAGDHPCDACATKPCLASCPANAVTELGFDVFGCRSYLRTSEGQTGCMTGGCLARAACPVGQSYRYSPAQLGFHMAALQL
jgi:hypothetical protein